MNPFLKVISIATVCIALYACKKKSDDTPAPANSTTPPVEVEYYLKGSFGDSALSYEQKGFNYNVITGRTITSDGVNNTIDAHFQHGSGWGPIGISYFKTKFNVEDSHYLFTEEDMKTVFPLGTSNEFCSYDAVSGNSTDGWYIDFMDKKGIFWTSNIGNQTNSFMKVDSKTPFTLNGKKYLKLKGSFSFNVYDENKHVKIMKGEFSQMYIGEDTDH